MSISGKIKSTGNFLQENFPGVFLTADEPGVGAIVHTFPYTELTMVNGPYPIDGNMHNHMDRILELTVISHLVSALQYTSHSGLYCLTDPSIGRAMVEMGIDGNRVKTLTDERIRGRVLMYNRIMYRFADHGFMIWIS